MLRDESVAPPPWAWPTIAATALLTAGCLMAAGLRFDWASAVPLCAACVALGGLARFYRTRRYEPNIAVTLSSLSQLLAFSALAAVLSYALAAQGGPLWDARLYALDRRLGLDWRAYLAFVDAHPRLGFVLTLAYRSLIVQMFLLTVVLGFSGRWRALRAFVTAFGLASLAAAALSALMPAMAMYVHLGLTARDFAHLDPAAAFVHVAHLSELRNGTLKAVSLDSIEGIVTFPSMHASLGVLFGYYVWTVRLVRIPLLLVNGLLIAATPIDGGHYFVDVLAGIAIAAAAIALAAAIHRRAPSAVETHPRRPGDPVPAGGRL
ncbi:phosphatase PAP2 family protein [Methylobacterium sp. NEAU 140]|uniref:phosphatase PAP2 family protein n=1 Tax=Methylobacterium sp. NEAU 140 TaxID=3064945 RepID=UPI002735AEA7|nr:phosphatase PAP2 family protein [Methylobacterium sp. NEAU 140]MDP4021305.1 phosphatase PAP2 family protein [Methylobacterium sp. NEAU 140]